MDVKGKGEQRRTVNIHYEFPEDHPEMIISVGEPEARVRNELSYESLAGILRIMLWLTGMNLV